MTKKKNKEAQYKSRKVHIGDVAVDSGRIVVMDPCNADEVVEMIGHTEGPTCYRKGKLNMGIGVILPTGIGDGIYPLIAVYDDTLPSKYGNRIARLLIEFANPFRNCGCQKAFPHDWNEVCYYGEPEVKQAAAEKEEGANVVN
jgi:hypothetical protein